MANNGSGPAGRTEPGPSEDITNVILSHVRRASSVDGLADCFLIRAFEAEARLIASGWFDPIGLHNAAHRCGLAGCMFADERLGFVFSCLCEFAEQNYVPSIDCFLVLAERATGVALDQFDAAWLTELIFDNATANADIEQLAATVVRLAGEREGAYRTHLKALAELSVDPSLFKVLIITKSVTPVSPGRKNAKRFTV